jgi:hypothetical protein
MPAIWQLMVFKDIISSWYSILNIEQSLELLRFWINTIILMWNREISKWYDLQNMKVFINIGKQEKKPQQIKNRDY